MARGYFTLEGKMSESCTEKRNNDQQFSTLYHVCNKECESMTAKGKKYSSLIKDGPHSFGDIIFHVFPPFSTWIMDGIIILQFFVSISTRKR